MNLSGKAQSGSMSDQQSVYTGLRVQTSVIGMVIPVVFGTTRISGNLIWYGDFSAETVEAGGKGGDSKGGGGSTTYYCSFILALCEGQVAGAGKVWANSSVLATVADAGLTLMDGARPQTPWPYLSSAHPTEALPYPGLAYVAASNVSLGSSPNIPNINVEIRGLCILPGINDANPAEIIQRILTDPDVGLGLPGTIFEPQAPPSPIGLPDYYNYCMAANFLLSPVFNAQKAAAEHIQDILDQTNAEAVWHDGRALTVVPYGDREITANGVTWTPTLTPLYDLTDDDYQCEPGADPILMNRNSQADAFNQQSLEYIDRTNDYNVNTIRKDDQGNIDLFDRRSPETFQAHGINQTEIAQRVVGVRGKRRVYLRNDYEFSLSWKYCLLEPMDIVSITDAALGLVKAPVRILKIEEDETGMLAITAEDQLLGTGWAEAYESQEMLSSLTGTGRNEAPGYTNPPVIFNAPSGVWLQAEREVWIALSGGDNWGGCDVYASTDDYTYWLVGRHTATSRYGELSAELPTHADPDEDNTLSVDLTISKGAMLSGTADDRDNFLTGCLVGDELISYQTATLTAPYEYDLTSLRRGQYHSAIATHAIGTTVVRLDDNLFKYPIDPWLLVGCTIYLKFASVNLLGQQAQSLADIPAYPFVLGQGASFPSNVQGFAATQPGSLCYFSWTPVTDRDVAWYEIRRNAHPNTAWTGATVVVTAAKGSSNCQADVPAGDYDFLICVCNAAGQYSTTPGVVNLTVT